MRKNLKLVLFSVLAVLSLSLTAVFSSEVKAENAFTEDVCSGSYTAEQKAAAGCNEERTAGGVAVGVANVVLSIVGIIAVIMLIVGGAQYVMSQGDPSKVVKAKQIILYSVIGLMVALLAFAIVNFVLGEIG